MSGLPYQTPVEVIIIKIKKTSTYEGPPLTQKPTECVLWMEEWMEQERSPGKIACGGQTWVGNYSSCVIVCVNQAKKFLAAVTDIYS